MPKKKKPVNKQQPRDIKVLTMYGYGFFLASIVAILFSTVIPFSGLLLNPLVNHSNVILTLFTLVGAALLPPLAGYFVGEATTRSRSKWVHHYNGVLFAIASVWITYVLGTVDYLLPQSFFTQADFWSTLARFWSAAVTILVLVVIGMSYARRGNKQASLLAYRPFQIAFIGSITAHVVLTLVQLVVQLRDDSSLPLSIVGLLLSVILPVAVTLISYAVLRRSYVKVGERLTASFLSLSVWYVSTVVVTQLLWLLPIWDAFLTSYITQMVAGVVVSVGLWVAYLILIRPRK